MVVRRLEMPMDKVYTEDMVRTVTLKQPAQFVESFFRDARLLMVVRKRIVTTHSDELASDRPGESMTNTLLDT